MGKFISILIVLVLLVSAVYLFEKGKNNKGQPFNSVAYSPVVSPMPTPPSLSPSVSPAKEIILTYANGKLSTNNITLALGDTVTFVNNEDTLHWPASDLHPIHNICPGFDSLHGLVNGEKYSFTFSVLKVCPFHDHLHASKSAYSGKIIVGQ